MAARGRAAEGTKLTLRPEGTAGVVRAYVEAEMYKVEPVRKLYYMGPMFRRERPQKGRMRQFHQIGAEALGRGDPYIDAEILLLLHDFFQALGLTEPALQINSLGCSDCRPQYRAVLLAFLKDARGGAVRQLPAAHRSQSAARAWTARSLAASTATRDAPSILDSLCAALPRTFRHRAALVVGDPGEVSPLNPRMVRGLDYYCRTTFEWTTKLLGSQSAVAAGGRYDGLVQQLGGPPIPGVGFAMGVERLTMLLRLQERGDAARPGDLFRLDRRPGARLGVSAWCHRLRQQGIGVEIEAEARSLKSQMRRADKLKARSVVILGDDELAKGQAVLRDMSN